MRSACRTVRAGCSSPREARQERRAGFPSVTDAIKSPACLFLRYYSIKILHAVKYILNFIYSEGDHSFGCERVNKEENHTQCVLKVRGIISHLKNTT